MNHLDTAYAYGRDGESKRLIGRAIRGRRGQVTLATKVGVYWDEHGVLKRDRKSRTAPPALRGKPSGVLKPMRWNCFTSTPRRTTRRSPNPPVFFANCSPKEKHKPWGVSNLSVAQMETFAAECPFVACQVRYNWFQREIEADVLPWCRAHNVGVVAYEPLAMGLLTGKFTRDHVFPANDWRRQSPLFTGDAWTRNLAEVERLRAIAARSGCSVAQLAIALGHLASRRGGSSMRRQAPRANP